MKKKKPIYIGIGAAAALAGMLIVVYSTTGIAAMPKTDSFALDFTYEEANSNLKQSMQSHGILMSSALKFEEQKDIEKWCSFFTDQEKQKLVEYCTSTEIKDQKGNFLGNVHIVGSSSAPRLVFAILQSNPMIDNLEQVKTVFGTMTKELVCDCWEEVKPSGYDTIGDWVDALRDFHTSGDKPHSASKPLALASKHLQIELTTNKDGYLWELLIAQ